MSEPRSYTDEEGRFAVLPVKGVTPEAAEATVRTDFLYADEPLRYAGVQVVRIKAEEHHVGRKRRAHIFEEAVS